MKKNILIAVLMVATSWLLLPSCNSNADQNSTLQAPETVQPETQQPPATNAEQGEAEEDEDGLESRGKAVKTGLAAATDAQTASVNNLKTAFTGETTASAKYGAYAKKAQEEGLTQIAILFAATSKSEMIHANNHRAVLEDMGEKVPVVSPQFTVKTTQENLADAIAGESYEISTMYPEFMTTANSADNQLALTSLNYAYRTEQRHKPLYENALAALQNKQVATLPGQYLVCPTCGNTYDGIPPKRCRISMTPSERFVKINSL